MNLERIFSLSLSFKINYHCLNISCCYCYCCCSYIIQFIYSFELINLYIRLDGRTYVVKKINSTLFHNSFEHAKNTILNMCVQTFPNTQNCAGMLLHCIDVVKAIQCRPCVCVGYTIISLCPFPIDFAFDITLS